jgi:hypothetical protein
MLRRPVDDLAEHFASRAQDRLFSAKSYDSEQAKEK